MKVKMKRLTALLMAGIMAVSLAACGASPAKTTEGTGEAPATEETQAADAAVEEGTKAAAEQSSGETVEIRFSWWGDTKRNEVYNEICDRFEAANPGIKVMREPVSWTDFWTKMATQVGGGNAPDVFGMHPQYAADYAMRGALLDLQPYVDDGTLDLSKITESVVDSGKYQDTLYMVSQGISFTCYLANEELAAEYGVTLPAYDEDWTWDQFKDEAKKFTDKAKDKGLYFSGDSAGAINSFRWYAREKGGDLYTAEGQLGFDEAAVTEWLTMWQELRDQGSVPDAATSTEDGTLALEQRFFTLGKSVLYNVPVNQLWLYQEQMKDNNIVPIRIPTLGNEFRAEYVEGAHFAVSSTIDEAHQEAAVKLVNFFVNTKESMELFKMEQGVPANTDMAEMIKPLLDESNVKAIDFATALMKICEPAVYAPKGASEIDTAYKGAAEQVSFGQSDAGTAAKQFVEEAMAILERNK